MQYIEGYYQKGKAKVRLLHTSTNTKSVDVYINNCLLLKDFRFKYSSEYLNLPEGSYQIDIFPEGVSNRPNLTKYLKVIANKSYTLVATDQMDALQLLVISDDEFVHSGETKIRFFHLSPNTPTVDIAIYKGDTIFPHIEYGEVTDYLSLIPMTVDLEVRKVGTKEVTFLLKRVNVKPNLAYTIAIVGLTEENLHLEAIFLVP
ncbi:DUF4397 domain-containing protein [Sutcliffiella halmapala]|uniref:DUF4397 domain-containing protein n=1 Tax=Sutcliffiella halmapala TaxID=79882 RepID=UPI0009958D97|nr:DUF4397 domain-containing protein [Sutcliffiella halmapala]